MVRAKGGREGEPGGSGGGSKANGISEARSEEGGRGLAFKHGRETTLRWRL